MHQITEKKHKFMGFFQFCSPLYNTHTCTKNSFLFHSFGLLNSLHWLLSIFFAIRSYRNVYMCAYAHVFSFPMYYFIICSCVCCMDLFKGTRISFQRTKFSLFHLLLIFSQFLYVFLLSFVSSSTCIVIVVCGIHYLRSLRNA